MDEIYCVCNELKNLCLEKQIFKRIAKIIIEEYDTIPLQPMKIREELL